MEDVIKVPERSRILEKKDDIRWEQMDDVEVDLDGEEIDKVEVRRSPGEMLEDAGAKVRAREQQLKEAGKVSPGVLAKLQTGNFVAYAHEEVKKVCLVGKVMSISKLESNVIVHKYRPASGTGAALQT